MKAPSRIDRSAFARWWWTVDHVSLAIIAAIATIGVVVLMAAGPGASARLGISDSFYFPLRQFLFLAPAAAVMLGVSFLLPLQARRLGTLLFAVALIAMVAALLFAPELNGAKRWFTIGAFGFQPSELAKPGFIVVAAWMLAEGARSPRFPGAAIAAGLYVAFLLLLILQPDYGQAALVTAVWMIMFFAVGWNMLWIGAIAACGGAALAFGYAFSPHLASRFEAFFDPEGAETYQVDKAGEAFAEGGLFGRASEGARVKLQLPDAHTDFIFAVAGEEGGFILAFVILALFAALVVRLLMKAAALKSAFAQCAVSGLAAAIGLQSLVNMGVALRALPAKGMTLPFISYGGSSLIATGLTFGFILALCRPHGTRRRREIMP